MPALKELAQRFHDQLQATRRTATLPKGCDWYPWASLGQFDFLDGFFHSDPEELLALIGADAVLDVGCGDGDIAFFLESLGAHVDAVDFAPTNYNALYGIRALKEKLGSKVSIHAVDLDRRPVLSRANYGLVVMLGVLYHLKNPILVLEALARRARHILLSTRVAAVTPGGKTRLAGLPVAYLVDERELNDDETNYWVFTQAGFERVVTRSGWDVVRSVVAGPADTADPVTPAGDARGFILASSRLADAPCPFRLGEGWHELEHGSWRWTARRFSVEFDLPRPQPPAILRLTFRMVEASLAAHPAIRLSARVNGSDLPPSTYTSAGEHVFSASVPALPAGTARVEFELDRALRPGLQDERELGVLVDFSGESPVVLGPVD